jgi:hypothetical protein
MKNNNFNSKRKGKEFTCGFALLPVLGGGAGLSLEAD